MKLLSLRPGKSSGSNQAISLISPSLGDGEPSSVPDKQQSPRPVDRQHGDRWQQQQLMPDNGSQPCDMRSDTHARNLTVGSTIALWAAAAESASGAAGGCMGHSPGCRGQRSGR